MILLQFSDGNYFKDLKPAKTVDVSLWLVNLVQLKKLFLKLSSYVELYLKQDWSLLPVPDFKLVAKSEDVTAHLNFMVAAVLLTATHSGRNREFEGILESVIPSDLRMKIKNIQEAFICALESRSAAANSPRKTSLMSPTQVPISPRVLFSSSSLSESNATSPCLVQENPTEDNVSPKRFEVTEFEDECLVDVTLQSIIDENAEEKFTEKTEVTVTSRFYSETTSECSPLNEELVNLQNEIKILEIKLSQNQSEHDQARRSEERQQEEICELRKLLQSLQSESSQMIERWEYEKIERNSLMVAFDQERHVLYERIDHLQQENEELSKQLQESNESTAQLQEAEQTLIKQQLTESLESFDSTTKELKDELEESRKDNTKLVKSLKKARDHIINQDELIKDLQSALQLSDSREIEIASLKEELVSLKEFHERERTEMNRVLLDLGGKIQKTQIISK